MKSVFNMSLIDTIVAIGRPYIIFLKKTLDPSHEHFVSLNG